MSCSKRPGVNMKIAFMVHHELQQKTRNPVSSRMKDLKLGKKSTKRKLRKMTKVISRPILLRVGTADGDLCLCQFISLSVSGSVCLFISLSFSRSCFLLSFHVHESITRFVCVYVCNITKLSVHLMVNGHYF